MRNRPAVSRRYYSRSTIDCPTREVIALLEPRRYPPDLEVLLKSVDRVQPDIAKLGDPLTAREMHNAVRKFSNGTDIEWIRRYAVDMNSPQSVAKILGNYAGDEEVLHVSIIKCENLPHQYVLEYQDGKFKKVYVTEVEDLLELPEYVIERLPHQRAG